MRVYSRNVIDFFGAPEVRAAPGFAAPSNVPIDTGLRLAADKMEPQLRRCGTPLVGTKSEGYG